MPKRNIPLPPEEIHLNSERDDIQRILGNPPGWALRWGITAVFVAVVLFMALGWLIKYPDVINAPVVIVTENPPIRVFARSSGKISSLLVEDKQEVAKGDLIAILENPAIPGDVRHLERMVIQWADINDPAGLLPVQLPEGLKLGELQGSYAAYQQAVHDFQFFEKQQGVYARISSLEQQIEYLEGLSRSLEKQGETLSREVALAGKNLDRHRNLRESGTVSEVNFDRAESEYLRSSRELEDLQSQVLNNRILIEQYRSQIIDLQEDRSTLSMQKWLATRELLDRLKSELELWNQTYLFTSPIAGRVSLTRVWGPQQFVQANEEIAAIVPEAGTGLIVGKAFLPTFNSGKVQPGMRVHIRLDGYPYQEFGVLQGQVREIALVPDQNNYLLEIALPDSLVTTYQRTIPFAQELPGIARIITEDRRVLERVFDRLFSMVKNQ